MYLIEMQSYRRRKDKERESFNPLVHSPKWLQGHKLGLCKARSFGSRSPMLMLGPKHVGHLLLLSQAH